MKPAIVSILLLITIPFAACHKPQEPTVPTHTSGMGGIRNWHVFTKSRTYHHITPDSAVYEYTDMQNPSQSFAISVAGEDTVVFNNQKYAYSHTSGSCAYFPIWHRQYSGNSSTITYNTDSNVVHIYISDLHVNSQSETWYYSF